MKNTLHLADIDIADIEIAHMTAGGVTAVIIGPAKTSYNVDTVLQ